MNQEIKLKLEQAAYDYGFRVPYDNSMNLYDLDAIKHFKAGAQTILDNPGEWGLCSLEVHKQAVKTFDKITMDAINAERAIVDERNQLQSQLAKYREALERIRKAFSNSPYTEYMLNIAKEVLKQEVNND